MEESSSGKRKRSDTADDDQDSKLPACPDPAVATAVAAAAAVSFPLLNLPSSGGPIQILTSFRSRKEQAALRLTCQSLNGAVEDWCQKGLQRIKAKHHVDDTFDARIRNVMNIETSRTEPGKFHDTQRASYACMW